MANGVEIFRAAIHHGCPRQGAAILALQLAPLSITGNRWPAHVGRVILDLEKQIKAHDLDLTALALPFADLKISRTPGAAREWLEGHIGEAAVEALFDV